MYGVFSYSLQVPDSAILECQDFTNMDGKLFHDFKAEGAIGRAIPKEEQ